MFCVRCCLTLALLNDYCSANAREVCARLVAASIGDCSPRITALLLQRVRRLSAGRANEPTEPPMLTMRQWEIVDLIDQGLSNKEIAGQLYIEVATVKNHVHNILDRLGVRRRSEAAARVRGMRERPRQYQT